MVEWCGYNVLYLNPFSANVPFLHPPENIQTTSPENIQNNPFQVNAPFLQPP